MHDAIITLTTDFGEADAYVAAMKGAILSVNPAARMVDLTHAIPPQDVLHAAIFLSGAVPYFPADTLHVVVVDPGVGTQRELLYIELGSQRLLVPDNGLVTLLEKQLLPRRAFCLRESQYWRSTIRRTFHGRDILAVVAGHLSLGLDPSRLGPSTAGWQRLQLPEPRMESGRIHGELIHIDHFGNLLTNISTDFLAARSPVQVEIVGRRVRFVETYGHAELGELVALISSNGFVEVAVTQGSASKQLGAVRGTPVVVHVA